MSGIKRYILADATGKSAWMEEDDDGDYVLYSDHVDELATWKHCAAISAKDANELQAEVSRLRADLKSAAKAALDAVALSCEKEREADALRVDAMRYRWLRDQAPWSDSKNPCPYSEQEDGQLRCITAGLDEQIDAAMGASA